MTRQELFSFDGTEPKTSFQGLAFGTYDAWLEQRDEEDRNEWSRVGQPTKVVIEVRRLDTSARADRLLIAADIR